MIQNAKSIFKIRTQFLSVDIFIEFAGLIWLICMLDMH